MYIHIYIPEVCWLYSTVHIHTYVLGVCSCTELYIYVHTYVLGVC